MARFADFALLCGILIIGDCTAAPAGNADVAKIPVIDGHVTLDQFNSLTVDPKLKACHDNQCTVLRSLVSSYEILQRFYTPNTMAQTKPTHLHSTRPILPIQVLLRDHPALNSIATDQLATIAQGVQEWTHELLTIEIATLVESDTHTIRTIIRSVPKTDALKGITETARQLCVVHHEPNCKIIRRD